MPALFISEVTMPVKSIIPDDWDEETDGWTVMTVCVPNSVKWRALIQGKIQELTFGRNWDEKTGIVKTAQQIGERIMDGIMSDCSQLFTAISEAIVSINNSISVQTQLLNTINLSIQTQINVPDCGCEGVGTIVEPPLTEEYPPIGEGEDFETIAAYNDYKCIVATTIVYDIRSVQSLLKEYFNSGYFLGGAAIIAATVGPVLQAAGLAAVVATIGAVAKIVQAIITGETLDWDNMIAQLDAKKSDLECAMFCAGNATEAQTDCYAILDSASLNSVENAYLKLYFISPVLNTLFEYNANYPKYFLAYDCSECDCASVYAWEIALDYNLGVRANNQTQWGIARVGSGDTYMYAGSGPHTINSVPGYDAATGAPTGQHWVGIAFSPWIQAHYSGSGTLPSGEDCSQYGALPAITIISQPNGGQYGRQCVNGLTATGGPYAVTTYQNQLLIYWSSTSAFSVQVQIG